MKLVFAGTPEVAVPALDALIASGRHEVAAVVTRPDAPAGRGRRLVASPVAERAEEAGIEVLKPAKPRDPGFLDRRRRSRPTAAPSSPTAPCCPASPWTCPPAAG
ncbi:Methionyl-tRNA formyltransferase OS=Streptomyces tendae OX=1932 GN=fmt PE=3 SV=1 [Streptomyces tendae]